MSDTTFVDTDIVVDIVAGVDVPTDADTVE